MSRCSGRFRSAPACGPSCRSRGPLGPVEADLASLVVRDRIHGPYPPAREALAAYGPYGAELVELYVPVQAVFPDRLAPGDGARRAGAERLLDERLAWFRSRV